MAVSVKPLIYVIAASLVLVGAGVVGVAMRLRTLREPVVQEQARKVGEAAGAFQLGGKLPDFTLTAVDGAESRFSEYLDGEHFVVVNFHHPDCPCAANCAKLINEMADAGYEDVRVLGIMSADTEDERVLAALDEQRNDGAVRFPVFLDKDKSLQRLFGAERTPEMWVLDKDGKIAFWGAPENSLFPGKPGHRFLLREAIDALRLGREPEIRRYAPIGCPIEG